MNLDLVRHKSKTEGLLPSKTKSCETLIKQTHRRPEKTLEYNFIEPRNIFSFKPPTSIEGF